MEGASPGHCEKWELEISSPGHLGNHGLKIGTCYISQQGKDIPPPKWRLGGEGGQRPSDDFVPLRLS